MVNGDPVSDPRAGTPESEWWLTVEMAPGERGLLAFIDPSVAEDFARYLLDQGADAVALEHWRDGRRHGIAMLGPPPPDAPAT